MKKRIVIISSILLLMIIGVGIYFMYGTLAVGTSTSEGEVYRFDITDDSTTVTVPANSSKIVFFKIKNTNNGTVRYGIGYTNKSNIEVLAYNDGFDEMTGLIKKNEYKFIKLRVINNTFSSQSTKISTILGYENGGDLIVPSDKGLVSGGYPPRPKITTYIIDLYNNASKTEVVNYDITNDKEITYNSAPVVSLMNDRLGSLNTPIDDGNIRYYGANPNNYIYFNCSDYSNQSADTCELWRIIGVFKDIELADGTKKDLVKIVRNDSIGNYSWDTSDSSVNGGYGKNDWSQADLMKLLNPGYESESIGGSLYWNSQSGTCFSNFNNETTPCDFTGSGLKNNATRNKIAEVTWNLGEWSGSGDFLSSDIYRSERKTEVVQSGFPIVWKGKIALIYLSDYGYAADFNTCSTVLAIYAQTDGCRDTSWLISDSNFYLTPDSNVVYVFQKHPNGYLLLGYTSNVNEIRPTLFLNAKEVIVGGDGSQSGPFQLGK